MQQNRIKWVDIVRGLFMVFIVVGHVFFYGDSAIRWYVFSFHVPAFFFVSGYCFHYTEKFSDFIAKRLVRLVIPYISLSIVFVLLFAVATKIVPAVGTIYTFQLEQSIKTVLYSNYNVYPMKYNLPLWFLPCLFFVEFISYWIERLAKKRNRPNLVRASACVFSIVAGIVVKLNLPWHIETAMGMLVWYELGVISRTNMIINAITKMQGKIRLISSLMLILCGAILPFFNTTNLSVIRNLYGYYPIYYFSCLCSITGYIILAVQISSCKILEYIGRKTMHILVFHKIPIIFFQYFWNVTRQILNSKDSVEGVIIGIGVTVLAILISLGIGEIVEKFCPILLGMKRNRYEDSQ